MGIMEKKMETTIMGYMGYRYMGILLYYTQSHLLSTQGGLYSAELAEQ